MTTAGYDLITATFATQAAAENWAYHVARTSQRHCKVKRDGNGDRPWRVYRSKTEGSIDREARLAPTN